MRTDRDCPNCAKPGWTCRNPALCPHAPDDLVINGASIAEWRQRAAEHKKTDCIFCDLGDCDGFGNFDPPDYSAGMGDGGASDFVLILFGPIVLIILLMFINAVTDWFK